MIEKARAEDIQTDTLIDRKYRQTNRRQQMVKITKVEVRGTAAACIIRVKEKKKKFYAMKGRFKLKSITKENFGQELGKRRRSREIRT